MKKNDIHKALVEVITEIQTNCSLDCPSLNSTLVPAKEVPCFDSKVWLVATTMLASKLEVKIPNDSNIFIDQDSSEPMNMNDICELVFKIVETNKSSEEAA